jgi:hypothetical protein
MAVPALAQECRAIGFTEDGTVFVVGQNEAVGGDSIGTYFLFNARTKQEELYAVEQLTPEEYREWVAENALAPLKTGPKSPDGKREVQVTGKGGRWKDGLFQVEGVSPWTGDDSAEVKIPPPSKFRFSVKAGKKSWTSAEFTFPHMNVTQLVEPVWSPDGGRVAYLVHEESATDRNGIGFSVTFGPTQGPRVQVLGVKGTASDVYEEAQSALEAAGLAPVAEGEAKAAHPTTVVFAAKGFEAEAKKAAKALPGAKVDVLTWKPGYELVVVLGGK